MMILSHVPNTQKNNPRMISRVVFLGYDQRGVSNLRIMPSRKKSYNKASLLLVRFGCMNSL